MNDVDSPTAQHSPSVSRVIENLRRTQIRLNVLEHHLREIAPDWADVACDLAEEVASDASVLEHLRGTQSDG